MKCNWTYTSTHTAKLGNRQKSYNSNTAVHTVTPELADNAFKYCDNAMQTARQTDTTSDL